MIREGKMSMIKIIIKRELLDQLMSAKFAIGVFLCLVLMVVGTYLSVKDYERRLQGYSLMIQDKQEAIKRDLEVNPDDPGIWSVWKIYRKPEVLGVVSKGILQKLGDTADLNRYRLRLTSSGETLLLPGFTSIDFTFVVRVFLSLLAIFFSYNLISGEREAGTLKLTISNSVKRSTLLLGKACAGITALIIPLAIGFLLATLIMELSSQIQFRGEEYLRLWLIFGISVLYLSCFFLAGLLFSTLTKRSSETLLWLLIFYTCLVVIIPNTSVSLTKRLLPFPAYSKVAKELADSGIKGLTADEYRQMPPAQAMLKERTIADTIYQKFLDGMHRQTKFARFISRLSPSAVYSYAASTLARTDLSSYENFMRGLRRQRGKWSEALLAAENGKKVYPREYEYRPMRESLQDSLSFAFIDICLLLIINILLFIAAHLSFLRYEV
jgi:ABC-type transport system involved in multi-copper enzyme maturation permease subunit